MAHDTLCSRHKFLKKSMGHLRYGVLAKAGVKEEHVVFATWGAQVRRNHAGPERKLPSQVVTGSRQYETQFMLFPIPVFRE